MGSFRTLVASLSIFLFGCIAPVDNNIEKAQLGLGDEDILMPPLVPVGPAVGGPFTSIDCPVDGATIVALDIRRPVADLLRNDQLHDADINTRVLRAGDTMTGTLTITPGTAVPALVLNAATNTTAAAINGNGTAAAVTILAGASNGSVVAQSNNSSYTIDILNSGAGGGLQVQGSVGSTTPALNVAVGTAPTATVPKYGIQVLGSITHLGTPPNANVDVGIDGFVARQNIVTASAIVESDGAGNFTVVGNAGFNVATYAGTAGGVGTVTFARNLPGNNYRMHIDAEDGYRAKWNGVQNVGNFQFNVRDQATNALVDLTTTAVTISISTVGF